MVVPRGAAIASIAFIGMLVVSPAIALGASPPSRASHAEVPTLSLPQRPAGAETAFSIGMNATLVLGQNSVNGATTPGVTATNLTEPNGVAFDSSGNLWVLDAGADRALEYRSPLRTGEAASVVIGQPNMTSEGSNLSPSGLVGPSSLAISPSGDLWISDFAGERVLEYAPPFSDGMNATLVLGQISFAADDFGTNNSTLYGPNRIAFDPAGDLWVADTWNNRVLEFCPPFSTGMAASLVIGQPSFTSGSSGLNQSSLNDPRSVAVSSSMLWVADSDNNRILGFAPPYATDENATIVLGQSNFNSSGGSGPNSTSNVVDLFVDGSGDLWAADYDNNRVVEFTPPFTDFEAPALVVGQGSLSSVSGGSGAANLTEPTGVALAPNGILWIADSANNRVLGYGTPTSITSPANYSLTFRESGAPPGVGWSVTLNGTTLTGRSPEIAATVTNGTYPWSIATPPAGYRMMGVGSGSVVMDGAPRTVDVVFEAVFTITITESGLPAGAMWSVTFNGSLANSTSPTIEIVAPNGTYPYAVSSSAAGYGASPGAGTYTVSPSNTSLTVRFSTTAGAGASVFGLPPIVLYAILGCAVVAITAMALARRRSKKRT